MIAAQYWAVQWSYFCKQCPPYARAAKKHSTANSLAAAVGSSCVTPGLDDYVCVWSSRLRMVLQHQHLSKKIYPVNGCDTFRRVVGGDQCGLIAM